MQENDKRIPKIHFLLELLALILKFDGSYEFLKADLEVLEDYSVKFRYLVMWQKKTRLNMPMPRLGPYEISSDRN